MYRLQGFDFGCLVRASGHEVSTSETLRMHVQSRTITENLTDALAKPRTNPTVTKTAGRKP